MNWTNGRKRASAVLPCNIKLSRLACVMLLLLVAPMAVAQNAIVRGPVVAEIIIYGSRNVPREKLESYIYTKRGREFSEKIAREDFTRLAGSHLCRPVDMRTEPTNDGRVNVVFLVQEYRSIVREVEYRHAKHVSAKELEGISRVQRGMPLDSKQNHIACFEIQEYLKKQGYYFANVSLLEGFDDSHDRVVFNITEGPVVRVRHVNFVGQKTLATTTRLNTQIDTSAAVLQSFGGKFQPFLIENDVIKLEEYYRNNGYLNVHVSRELKFTDDFQMVDIIFHIQEGIRYRIADWTIEGTKIFPREALASIVMLKKGDYYNEANIKTDIRNISDYGGYRGYQLKVESFYHEVPGDPGLIRVQYVVEFK